jgi:hypothetical protein
MSASWGEITPDWSAWEKELQATALYNWEADGDFPSLRYPTSRSRSTRLATEDVFPSEPSEPTTGGLVRGLVMAGALELGTLVALALVCVVAWGCSR